MHFAIDIATLGDYADPRKIVQFAQAAEAAGWEGLFVWDHLAFAWGVPSGDPWVILSAAAQATQTIKLGAAVTPLPRRRPQVLANTVATLDLLSGGRFILGAGLGGVPQEYAAFGEPEEAATRARKLDESLEIVSRLFAGEAVSHQGEAYTMRDVSLSPLPIQRPRPPIWIGGDSNPALRRAARWDGWIGGGDNEQGEMIVTPQQVAEKVCYLHKQRTDPQPLEIALIGTSQPTDQILISEYAAAGVTWWLESIHGYRGSFDELMVRIKTGPAI